MGLRSPILKLALFATGLSGIVAEYILSTLATYFLGNALVQWTMIVSVMLFSMGLGSRLSQYIRTSLLAKFVYIELALSFLVSFSSLIAYTTAGYSSYTGLVIYVMSISIGLLIGLEIPLVIRLNKEFQSLRINIASVMEKDYWGSLIGGIFFAFVGLPYLGLTYTPFVLGAVNFLVALMLLYTVRKEIQSKSRVLWPVAAVLALVLGSGAMMARPIILYGEQNRYQDKVIYSEQSAYQRIVITQWKNDYWLYLNGNQQFSTIDEDKYHEPLVHPVMQMAGHPTDVLVLGGGDGCAVREILKYPSVEHVSLVDLDPNMTRLGQEHPLLLETNQGAMNNPKVEVINRDGFSYMEDSERFYDVIIIDLPDPRSVDLNRLYSLEFYRLCHRHLRPNGLIITQAGSPYYATKAFQCIDTTMTAAGFATCMLHNQVVTLGEWGWILGAKNLEKDQLKAALRNLNFNDVATKWINRESMTLMTSFGKNIYYETNGPLEVNTIHNPALYHYYLKGNWDLY